MTTLRHAAVSLAILGLLTSLSVTIFQGFIDKYDVQKEDTQDGQTIMEKLDGLNFLQGINDIGDSIEKLKKTRLSILAAGDILGALATAGAGVLKVIGGIVTFIPEILGVVTNFYFIPPIVSTVIGAVVILMVGFIILSVYLRSDV